MLYNPKRNQIRSETEVSVVVVKIFLLRKLRPGKGGGGTAENVNDFMDWRRESEYEYCVLSEQRIDRRVSRYDWPTLCGETTLQKFYDWATPL